VLMEGIDQGEQVVADRWLTDAQDERSASCGWTKSSIQNDNDSLENKTVLPSFKKVLEPFWIASVDN
jgi:hypothetical protein